MVMDIRMQVEINVHTERMLFQVGYLNQDVYIYIPCELNEYVFRYFLGR